MKATFLGQGLEDKSNNAVGNYLMSFFNEPIFHSFTGISAFASKSAILGLSQLIEKARGNYKKLTLIVGVDYEGTPKEALDEILNINIDSYIFYQAELNTIFHPKIYLFEGDNHVKLIIGSSNLTGRGLFVNVESSLLLEFNTDDTQGMTLLNELKNYYKSLFDFTDPNLFKINEKLIVDFVSDGVVPTEAITRRRYTKDVKLAPEIKDRPTANFVVPKRATASIPKAFQPAKKVPVDATQTNIMGVSTDIYSEDDVLWKSGPLTRRDLNIPDGANTNPTGSMYFKKGQMKDIDQRHYFRDVVFASLPWANDSNERTKHLERATAFFKIIIDDENFGVYSLSLTHNSKTDSAAYLQNNSMTQVSWGKAKEIIAKESLIGKSASLYKVKDSNSNEFVMAIK